MKQGLRQWTNSMAGDDLDQRLQGSRPENEYGVDPFGFSLEYALSAIGPFLWLYKNYFRVDTFGIEKVPPGRVLIVRRDFDAAAESFLAKLMPATHAAFVENGRVAP